MSRMPIRDVSLFVEVIGRGAPLLLMHGGPGADHWSFVGLRRLADRHTLILYDHRCNGRSTGAPVSSMTWENLTADADALRERLGFERWAVLGHSFGGHVALEYALRYPDRLSQLVLVNTVADSSWAREHAPRVLADRGYPPETVDLCLRFFTGRIQPGEMALGLRKFGSAYYSRPSLLLLARELLGGMWRSRMRPEALIFAGRHLLNGWSVVDRLGEIRVPTLVMAGGDDFLFPPQAEAELASAIPGAELRIIEGAGHDPWVERPRETIAALTGFLSGAPGPARSGRRAHASSGGRIAK
jgi:pimeloyl-ACP methyl ester carboxylesterase